MKLKDVRRLPTTRPKMLDTDSGVFPPLSGDEMMYLQGIVKDPLQTGSAPSTKQQRTIAKLMKLRLLGKGTEKGDGPRYRATPWGVALVGKTDITKDNDGNQTITARSNPHM